MIGEKKEVRDAAQKPIFLQASGDIKAALFLFRVPSSIDPFHLPPDDGPERYHNDFHDNSQTFVKRRNRTREMLESC
jgi:hypothetical protein